MYELTASSCNAVLRVVRFRSFDASDQLDLGREGTELRIEAGDPACWRQCTAKVSLYQGYTNAGET